MYRQLLGLLYILIASSTVAQTSVNEFNLALKNDSIRMIEEYYPAIDLEKYVLDLSRVDAACAKFLKINQQGNLISLYNKSKLLSAYRVQQNGFHIEYEPEIRQMLSAFGEVTMTNVSTNFFVDFPIDNEEVKRNQEQTYDVLISNLDPMFGDYDQLSFQVYVTQSLEIGERQKINYPFGQRLTVPISVENVYTIGEITGIRKTKKTSVDTDILTRDLPSEPVQYRYLINHHKGILLAIIKSEEGRLQSAQVFQELSDRSDLSECMADQGRFQLYPNPSYGTINIMLNNDATGDYRLEIFSVIGKKLYGETLTHEQTISKFTVTLPALPEGTYLYSMIDPAGHRMYTRRLTIVGF